MPVRSPKPFRETSRSDNYRHTSKLLSLEPVYQYRSRTASWHWGHGKEYGSWSSETGSIGGRCLLRFRARGSDYELSGSMGQEASSAIHEGYMSEVHG